MISEEATIEEWAPLMEELDQLRVEGISSD
jgi:hypothetical protein